MPAHVSIDWNSDGDGGQELRAIATDEKGFASPVVSYLISTSSSEGNLYPAESATISGGTIDSNHIGHSITRSRPTPVPASSASTDPAKTPVSPPPAPGQTG